MITLFCIMRLLPIPNASASISFLLGYDLRELHRIDVAARQRDERRVGHRHLPRQHRRKRRRAARFDDKVQLFERQPHRIAHLASRHHDTLDPPRLEYREIAWTTRGRLERVAFGRISQDSTRVTMEQS